MLTVTAWKVQKPLKETPVTTVASKLVKSGTEIWDQRLSVIVSEK